MNKWQKIIESILHDRDARYEVSGAKVSVQCGATKFYFELLGLDDPKWYYTAASTFGNYSGVYDEERGMCGYLLDQEYAEVIDTIYKDSQWYADNVSESPILDAEWFRGRLVAWELGEPDGFEWLLPALALMGFSGEYEYGNDEAPSIGIKLGEDESYESHLQVFYGVWDTTQYYNPNDERYSLKEYGYWIYESSTGYSHHCDSAVEVMKEVVELMQKHSQPRKEKV